MSRASRTLVAVVLACGALLLVTASPATPLTTRACPVAVEPQPKSAAPEAAPRCGSCGRGTWSDFRCTGAPVSDCC
jgi:hypothetical protein